MKSIPIELKAANEFVSKIHRHHPPVYRDKFRLACIADDGHMCGVIQAARPVSRILDDGVTIEIVRCCTDGTYNACSFMYSRITRIAKEMWYKKVVTYILEEEFGSSLKASGWEKEADTFGHSWDCPSRPRKTKVPQCNKQRWSKLL